jgi:diguanylate cyclase (GGDEF)-like protein
MDQRADRLQRSLHAWMSRRSSGFLLTISLLLMATVGGVDVITGTDVALSVLYLLPVSIATWFLHRRAGIFVSAIGCLGVLAADLASGTEFSGRFVPYWNAGARLAIFLAAVFLLSFLRELLEHERHLARTDPLTGVANARRFYELAQLELDRARRYGRVLTLAYVDVDDFKALNDDYGHSIGDAVLRAIAAALDVNVRTTDLVARLGGDEFAVLYPETGSEAAEVVVRRAQARLKDAPEVDRYSVTVSIGAATFLSPPSSVDELIWAADQFMYYVKRKGKDSVCLKILGNAHRVDDERPIEEPTHHSALGR